MIKANELRIGNLIYLKHGGNGYKLHFVSKSTINNYSNDKYDFIMPIPINEEILLRLGFEKSFKNDYWYSIRFGDKRLLVSILGNVEIEKWDRTMIGFFSICEYVHQLQNLYFALCGEELVFFSTEP